jgi:hypothetical protein
MAMLSRPEALLQIERALGQKRHEIGEIDQRIQAASNQLLELARARAEDFRELARLRVGMMAAGRLVAGLDEADRQAAALLASRPADLAALDERIEATSRQRSTLEAERATQAEALEKASAAVDAAEAATQARLEAEPAYREQQDRTREAERVARHAEDKASQSEQELGQKGQSYRDDPLFTYLWERRYGLPDYRATALVRWLDGKVSRLVGYDDARASYARLQEIPVRLREHARAVRGAAEHAIEALRRLDEQAREADGIPALEAARASERERLEAIDARIEEAAAAYQRLQDEKAAFAAGEDETYRKAVKYLASELRREDLRALRRDAQATPFPEDDLVIARLIDREQQEQALQVSLGELKRASQQHLARLQQVESLRADFKRRQYDRGDSVFADGSLLGVMLANFLSGLLDRDGLWRVLEQQQRYRPQRANLTFGSGGFGRGSVWGGGLGRGGGAGWGGGGRGGGGGGFRTGGGF